MTDKLQHWARQAANLLFRTTLLPGDSGPAHAWHHSLAAARGHWWNYVRASEQLGGRATRKWLRATPEAWGYSETLRLALASFSTATQLAIAKPEAQGVGASWE